MTSAHLHNQAQALPTHPLPRDTDTRNCAEESSYEVSQPQPSVCGQPHPAAYLEFRRLKTHQLCVKKRYQASSTSLVS